MKNDDLSTLAVTFIICLLMYTEGRGSEVFFLYANENYEHYGRPLRSVTLPCIMHCKTNTVAPIDHRWNETALNDRCVNLANMLVKHYNGQNNQLQERSQ
jgi:hypothetical protein